jgi:hypothetical protein
MRPSLTRVCTIQHNCESAARVALFKAEQTLDRVAATLSIETNAYRRDNPMSTNTLLLIIVVVLLLGGGGFYFR